MEVKISLGIRGWKASVKEEEGGRVVTIDPTEIALVDSPRPKQAVIAFLIKEGYAREAAEAAAEEIDSQLKRLYNV